MLPTRINAELQLNGNRIWFNRDWHEEKILPGEYGSYISIKVVDKICEELIELSKDSPPKIALEIDKIHDKLKRTCGYYD